jgi:hypothetical protein
MTLNDNFPLPSIGVICIPRIDEVQARPVTHFDAIV